MAYEVRTTERFDQWLNDLRDRRARQAVVKGLVKLASGLFGSAKDIGGGLHELKIDIGAGYRAYFVTRQQVIIVVLMGGDKSSQDRDIKAARKMADDLD